MSLKSSGIPEVLKSSFKVSIIAISSSTISKSKISLLLKIRSGLEDFGITEIPFCTAQRSPICAGVFAYFVPRIAH